MLKTQKQKKKKRKKQNKTKQNEYKELLDNKWKKMDSKYDLKILFLKGYDYCVWSENREKSTDKKGLTDKEKSVDLSDMLPLEGDEQDVKQGNVLKILTPKKTTT